MFRLVNKPHKKSGNPNLVGFSHPEPYSKLVNSQLQSFFHVESRNIPTYFWHGNCIAKCTRMVQFERTRLVHGHNVERTKAVRRAHQNGAPPPCFFVQCNMTSC